ncbi:HAD family hydrolase [Halorarum halobium]|uniref:HAD family hydrolase n=1 Tax=Halorarum halobium TaxID=3075121 RepID=UPI0028A72E06|nr:HAD family hydrolase [Halobaculum sp. XH14]
MTPNAVTFDLDGTLLDYRRSPGEILAVAFDSAGVDPLFPVTAYFDRFDEFNDRTDRMGELRAECFAALAEDRGHDPDIGRAVAAAFADARDHANVEWCPGAEPLLDALDRGGVPWAVVTNGPRDAQSEKLSAVGLDRRADAVVYAGHDTPAKPDREPFVRALEALGADPADAAHVGDSHGTDVVGARAVGMGAVHVRDGTADGSEPAPDLRVETLEQVIEEGWPAPSSDRDPDYSSA